MSDWKLKALPNGAPLVGYWALRLWSELPYSLLHWSLRTGCRTLLAPCWRFVWLLIELSLLLALFAVLN